MANPPPVLQFSSLSPSPTAKSSLPSLDQPVHSENQLYAFHTLRFSYHARDVELPPVFTVPSNKDNNHNLYNNENIDLTAGSSLTIIQPSHATVSRSKVSQSGAEVNGTMTLAYMACQMLPDPMHLREIWATAAGLPTGTTTTWASLPATTPTLLETASEGESLRRLAESAYAIEYFEDQGCTRFLMATAGSKVNIHEAEDSWVNTRGMVDSSVGSVSKTTAATTVESETLKEKIRHGRAVSVRWVGLVSPSEFLLEESKHVQDRAKQRLVRRHSAGRTRKEIRAYEEDEDDDDDDDDDDGDYDDEDDDDDAQTYDDMDDSSRDRRLDVHDDDSGYLSFVPFLPAQLYPPPRINLGAISPPPSTFIATVLTPGSNVQEEIESSNTHNGTQKAAAPTGLSRATSQIVMAGLVVGLLLFLGSFIMAVHYRQRRRKWYEETAEV